MDLSQKHFSQLRTLFLSLLLFATLGSGVAYGQFERNSRLLAGQGNLEFDFRFPQPSFSIRLSPQVMRFFTDRWALGVGGAVGYHPRAYLPEVEFSMYLVTRYYLHRDDAARWCPFVQLDPGFGQAWGQLPPLSNQGGRIEDIYVAVFGLSGGVGLSRWLTPKAGLEIYWQGIYNIGVSDFARGRNNFNTFLQAGFFLLLPGEGWQ